MSKPVITSSPSDGASALAYLDESLQGSLLVNQLGIASFHSECGVIDLITDSTPPVGHDFFTGWGGQARPCDDWLIQETLDYLRNDSDAVVLFEDVVSSPSDPYLCRHPHPVYWQYHNRILWPVVTSSADYHSVEQAMAWSASIRTIVIFSRLPSDFSFPIGSQELPDRVFQHIATSIVRLMTDIFDGEGYMVWCRRSEIPHKSLQPKTE